MNNDTKSARNELKNISNISTFNSLLDNLMLSDEDKDIMRLIYVKKKNLSYIADTFGYSESTIKNRHKKVLKLITNLL